MALVSEFTGRREEPAKSTYLFETKDYGVELVEITLENVPHPGLLRKYAIFHKAHRVIAGLSEQFGGAIEAARNLQTSMEQAVSGEYPENVPGSAPPVPRPPRGFGGPGTPPQLS